MREARAAIKELGPSFARSRLSLDLRAALINLDASLERAVGAGGNNVGAGPDQLEVYSRLAVVQELAFAEGPESVAVIRALVEMLDRRTTPRTRPARSRRPKPDSTS